VNSAEESADVIRRILWGETGPVRDIVALNAAAALVVAGREKELAQALRLAEEAIESGRAEKTLEALVRCSNASDLS
jgi:anthranilate phosphoribosyltransferase